ncbi:MAG: hypothetical protein IKJ69_05515 [Clostridia bacterium]|nr:hypothetical protein [Clostridia bacterium]
MKKVLSLVLSLLMIFGCMSIGTFAADDIVKVYVSVANKGELVAAQVAVDVKDIDSDGALTVNDALYAVHEAVYDGGAQAGYSYYTHKVYGISLGKLWGDASGNFGYYLNNSSCWSLADTVKDGDYLTAFVYKDAKLYSDTYCFFSDCTVTANKGDEIELTLNGAGYDASWNPITVTVADAEITVDGVATGVKTDENGKATIKIDKVGEHIISAVSASQTIVPPVCTAQINGIFEIIVNAVVGFFMSIINFITSLFA